MPFPANAVLLHMGISTESLQLTLQAVLVAAPLDFPQSFQLAEVSAVARTGGEGPLFQQPNSCLTALISPHAGPQPGHCNGVLARQEYSPCLISYQPQIFKFS